MSKKYLLALVAAPFISLIIIATGILIVMLILFTGYTTEMNVWWNLKKIPNIEILSLKQSASEGFIITTINVKEKGVMTFSGWSLSPNQFKEDNTHSIGLSKIDSCEVFVIGDISQRGWVLLDKEVDLKITTVQKAIDNYDKILDKIKSLPKYSEGTKKEGIYSICK